MTLKDADELIWPAVRETLAALNLGPEDAAAAKAAERIAANIDCHPDGVYTSRWLMPELLKYLDALGATPEARARITRQAKPGGDNAPKPEPTWLDQQRQSRSARGAKRTQG